ncbi:E3 binding domain-containing protein [Rhodococcus sp. NPDC057529]|uniref:E3 binding domain-containing protein n=1 Tax=Rhodococcus sp. NPDC057529 TaxID=3346158 RepID=UPI00366CFAFB
MAELRPATDVRGQNAHSRTGCTSRIIATPLIRRIARERGIDLATVRGSGPAGRVVRKDVESS